MRAFITIASVLIVLISCGEGKTVNTPGTTDSIPAPKRTQKVQKYTQAEYKWLAKQPVFTGKIARSEDVKSNAAVFSVTPQKGQKHTVLSIKLPYYAYFKSDTAIDKKLLLICQAEKLGNDTLLGYRAIDRTTGMVSAADVISFSDIAIQQQAIEPLPQ